MTKKSGKAINELDMVIPSISVNESFARSTVSIFLTQLDPTMEEIGDIRTIISEAVTNCVVHAYHGNAGKIYINVKYYDDRTVKLSIKDKGCGIPDVKQAMEPLYTTDTSGERGGMGFAIMKSFTDKISVISKVGKGTTVTMLKRLS
jgi:stage II sporulation protein AB (anti-sigma F factor)